MIGKIAVKKQLDKQIARMEALENKYVKTDDWIQELIQQVYALNKICEQQQEEIESLKSSI